MTKHLLSIAFQTDKPITAYGPLAKTVEDYGFDVVSVYNDLLFQPAWLPLLEIARHTNRIRLGPAAVNPFTCHPVNIAGNIALIDEAAQGRAYLGLARGGWLDYLGVEPDRPVTAMREALGCVRHLLTRSTAPYPGEIFPLGGGASLRWPVYRSDIPFLLGTWGLKTIRACIDDIAEVKIGGTANPAIVTQLAATIAQATTQLGRDPTEVTVVVGAVSVVDEDRNAARALARRKAALYLPIIAQLDHTLEMDPDLLSRIREATAVDDFDKAGTYISDELLRRLAFAGTPDEVAEQALEMFEAGAGRVEFGTPHGLTADEGLRLLGEQVLPALHGSTT